MKKNEADLIQYERDRNNALKEIGNHLHDSVIISNDEVASLKYLSKTLSGASRSNLSSSISTDCNEKSPTYVHANKNFLAFNLYATTEHVIFGSHTCGGPRHLVASHDMTLHDDWLKNRPNICRSKSYMLGMLYYAAAHDPC